MAHYSRGFAKLLQDHPDEAVAEFSQAIKLDPIFMSAFAARGLAYQKLGDLDRAKADFNAALEIPIMCGGDRWAHDVAQQGLTPSPSISADMVDRGSGESSISPMIEDTFSGSEN